VAASLFTSYSQDDLMLRLGASQAVSPVRSQGQDPTRTKGPMLGQKGGRRCGKTIET